MDTVQIFGFVNHNLSLGLTTEARHNEILAVTGPEDAGALLGDDVPVLLERLETGARTVDTDPAISADRGQEPAALGPGEAVDLVRVALEIYKMLKKLLKDEGPKSVHVPNK